MGNHPQLTKIVVLAVLMMASGCSDENARVAQVSVEAAQRQAEQVQEMSRLNREVAAGTKRLIEGQAEADQHWQTMQQGIHDQFNQLETERRQQADTRQRESLLAPVLLTLGVLLVCSLALLVCWRLLTGLGPENEEPAMTQLLLDEIGRPGGTALFPPDIRPALNQPDSATEANGSQPARLLRESD